MSTNAAMINITENLLLKYSQDLIQRHNVCSLLQAH
jgi:hypothetical protein